MLADSVYDRLRLSMMRAELVPHQRLKVRDLAQQMGTSETPVREALLQLAREGAVEVRPRFFIRVPRLTLADAIHQRLMSAEQRRDWRTALEANRDFHFGMFDRAALKRRDPYGLRVAIRLDLIEGGRGLMRRIAEQEARGASGVLKAQISRDAISIN